MKFKFNKYQLIILLLVASALFILGLILQDITYTLFSLLIAIFVEKFGHHILFKKEPTSRKEILHDKYNFRK